MEKNRAKKILFFDSKPYDIKVFEEANKECGYELKFQPGHLTEDTVALAEGYDVICVFVNDQVTEKVLGKLVSGGVKLIALRSAGYNNVDLKAVFNKIHVVRVPEYSPYAVAEHAAALMLTLNRKIHVAYHRIRDNNFAIDGLMGFDMRGKTAGVLGTGKIGIALLRILKGFGMELLAYDPMPKEDLAREVDFKYTDLDTLYSESDIISLNCPLSKDTEYIVSAEGISKMKDGVMLINTGRGKLIDTRALIDGLKSRKIGYAGLDVYEEESEYFFEDFSGSFISDDVLARLLTFPNVIITSHQGFFTKEALGNIAATTLDNIKDFFEGNYLKNEICYKCDKKACTKKQKKRCF